MKIFLDANVIISVVNKEYPAFTYSARILSLSGNKYYELYTSPLCLAITCYFASKKSGQALAKQKIEKLLDHLKLTTINETVVKRAIQNVEIHDFEDGLEYYSAIDKSCDIIITENKADFFFSNIEVLSCEEFIAKYL